MPTAARTHVQLAGHVDPDYLDELAGAVQAVGRALPGCVVVPLYREPVAMDEQMEEEDEQEAAGQQAAGQEAGQEAAGQQAAGQEAGQEAAGQQAGQEAAGQVAAQGLQGL